MDGVGLAHEEEIASDATAELTCPGAIAWIVIVSLEMFKHLQTDEIVDECLNIMVQWSKLLYHAIQAELQWSGPQRKLSSKQTLFC